MKRTILIVDDEPEVVDLFKFQIEHAGCIGLVAHSGNEALAVIANQKVDIIVSDICMPDGTGIDLLKTLRARQIGIPVILMTGFSDITRSQALEQGAYEFVEKPLDFSEMTKFIADALASQTRDL